MVTTREQMQHIYLLSDSVLYGRALDFFEKEREPLSNAQINGLLNIAQASTYALIREFVKRQYERDSQEKNVKIFYKDLELILKSLPILAQGEELLTEGLTSKEAEEESNMVNLLLTREFIQHLAAENMPRKKLADEKKAKEKREKEKWQAK